MEEKKNNKEAERRIKEFLERYKDTEEKARERAAEATGLL